MEAHLASVNVRHDPDVAVGVQGDDAGCTPFFLIRMIARTARSPHYAVMRNNVSVHFRLVCIESVSI